MAEEEVIVAAPATTSDCKRKFEDAHSDDGENKRPRFHDDNQNHLANTNRHQEKKVAEPEENATLENAPSEEVQDVSKDNSDETAEPTDIKEIPVEDSKEIHNEDSGKENDKEPSKTTEQLDSRSIEVPSNMELNLKDLLESIYQLENLMNAMIAETDAGGSPALVARVLSPNQAIVESDQIQIQVPNEKEFDLNGFLESLDKAEKLMDAMIAEADFGDSPALVARVLSPAQAIVGSDQIQIQVPNEKLIPKHLPEGDDSKERTAQVTGDKRQIEIAQEMIKEALSQADAGGSPALVAGGLSPSQAIVRSDQIQIQVPNEKPVRSSSGGFGQQAYRPPQGSGVPPQWGQRGSLYGHPPSYVYQNRMPYPSHNQSYAPTPYGNYPQHMAPRSSYGSGWEQRPHQSLQGPPSHNGGYFHYGGQGGHSSAQHPSSVPQHGTGPSPLPSMGPSSAQMNYNYRPPQGQNYGQQTPYQQAGHCQQGYDESKYKNRVPAQYPYGGHPNPQPIYPQARAQANYAPPEQYGKPPLYGVPPLRGQHPQSFGHPRATQPGEIPYQGCTPAQLYGRMQLYPYASSGPSQAGYPTYGSAPAAGGYNPPQSVPGQAYAQPGGQPRCPGRS